MALVGIIVLWLGAIALWFGGAVLSLILFGANGIYAFILISGITAVVVGAYLEGRVFKKSGP